MKCIVLAIKALCCVANTNQSIKNAEATGCCLPIQCCLAIKDCYDQNNAQVGVENHDVQMTGVPAPHVME